MSRQEDAATGPSAERKRGAAPGFDRSRHGTVVQRPAQPGLRSHAQGAGKTGGVIACEMAHRATRIAYAMVCDQAAYDLARWQ
jgi:hypothetical protein